MPPGSRSPKSKPQTVSELETRPEMKRNEFMLEICANSLQSVLAAKEGGADRVELCAALPEGGTTPSFACIRHACAVEGITVNVLIRPRSGDFLYGELDQEIMLQDIAAAKFLGADGIVAGMLNADGSIDAAFLKKCVQAAYPLPFTFHRAFDMCRDPFEALEVLEYCGCNRLLTSGMRATALEGIALLGELVEKSRHVSIMPGGGINAGNIARIARETGAKEFHLSARARLESNMLFRNTGIRMGGNPEVEEYAVQVTSKEIVRETIEALESL